MIFSKKMEIARSIGVMIGVEKTVVRMLFCLCKELRIIAAGRKIVVSNSKIYFFEEHQRQ
jgi:hypothetical protein